MDSSDAEKALADAITNVHIADHGITAGVCVKYIVLAQVVEFDDDGNQVVSDCLTESGDGIPLSDRLGMLEHAATVTRHQIVGD